MVGLLAAQVATDEADIRDIIDKYPFHRKTFIPAQIFHFKFLHAMMLGIQLLLLLLQISLLKAVQAASPSPPLPKAPIIHLQTPKPTDASDACDSLANDANNMCLLFTDPGSPIPAAELRHTLSVAKTEIEAHIPGRSHEPIYTASWETNLTFPETGDNIYLWFYAYTWRLSWVQLSQALKILEEYVRGVLPGHPGTHFEEIEFYVRLAVGVEAARGGVDFRPGSRAVAKRNPATTILQLPQANLSSHQNADLPIIWNIPKTNLDLNVTAIGLPIPKDTVLDAIDAAFTDIAINHEEDIDLTIPKNLYPYTFNFTSGKLPHLFVTQISISAFPGKKISWGLLCILYFGLRDFIRDTEHFNNLRFEVEEKKVRTIGHGEVLYWPVGEEPSTQRLTLG